MVNTQSAKKGLAEGRTTFITAAALPVGARSDFGKICDAPFVPVPDESNMDFKATQLKKWCKLKQKVKPRGSMGGPFQPRELDACNEQLEADRGEKPAAERLARHRRASTRSSMGREMNESEKIPKVMATPRTTRKKVKAKDDKSKENVAEAALDKCTEQNEELAKLRAELEKTKADAADIVADAVAATEVALAVKVEKKLKKVAEEKKQCLAKIAALEQDLAKLNEYLQENAEIQKDAAELRGQLDVARAALEAKETVAQAALDKCIADDAFEETEENEPDELANVRAERDKLRAERDKLLAEREKLRAEREKLKRDHKAKLDKAKKENKQELDDCKKQLKVVTKEKKDLEKDLEKKCKAFEIDLAEYKNAAVRAKADLMHRDWEVAALNAELEGFRAPQPESAIPEPEAVKQE